MLLRQALAYPQSEHLRPPQQLVVKCTPRAVAWEVVVLAAAEAAALAGARMRSDSGVGATREVEQVTNSVECANQDSDTCTALDSDEGPGTHRSRELHHHGRHWRENVRWTTEK